MGNPLFPPVDYLLRIFIVFIAFAVNSFTRLAPWTKCKFTFKCAECAKFMGRQRINFIPGSTCYPTCNFSCLPLRVSCVCCALSVWLFIIKKFVGICCPKLNLFQLQRFMANLRAHTHVWAGRGRLAAAIGRSVKVHERRLGSTGWQRVIPTCCPVNLIELRFTFHTFYAGFFITLLLLLLLLL